MNLHEVLMEKARSATLGHFYIIESSGDQANAAKSLEEFVHNFIREYYQKVEGHRQSLINLMDHPDVFVLGNLFATEEQDEGAFSVVESEALARFFEFRPVQGGRKFAVIMEGHRINTLVANKWLKLLEEPQGMSTIFLLNPRRQKLLDTIHSRALHLRLPLKPGPLQEEVWHDFLKETKTLGLAAFIEKNVKGEKDLTFWVDELIQWEALKTDQFLPKNALKEWLKNFQEMDIFHQPSATKWSLFYSFLHQTILPRFEQDQ